MESAVGTVRRNQSSEPGSRISRQNRTAESAVGTGQQNQTAELYSCISRWNLPSEHGRRSLVSGEQVLLPELGWRQAEFFLKCPVKTGIIVKTKLINQLIEWNP